MNRRWKRVAWRLWIVVSVAWALFWLIAFAQGGRIRIGGIRLDTDFVEYLLVVIAPQVALLSIWFIGRWVAAPVRDGK